MAGYQGVIPEEEHFGFEFIENSLSGIATVNCSIDKPEFREAFSHHLSIKVHYTEACDQQFPSSEEQSLLCELESNLDPIIKSANNALFLARVTHGGVRKLHWRIYDAEIADRVCREVLSESGKQRVFEYQIERDEEWRRAEWFFEGACGQR